MVLFGGLITVPFWGYRNTPLAMLEIMMSDLPRVAYGKEQILEKEVKEAERKMEEMKKTKRKGLGLNLANAITPKERVLPIKQ